VLEAPRDRRDGLGQARFVIGSIAVSALGTWAYNVGIAVYAYERTHSAAWVSVVTVGRYVPALALSWLAGRLVDRWPRRGLAMSADTVCVVVMLALAGLGEAKAPVWIMAVVAALSSTSARVQATAVTSLAADVTVESALLRMSTFAGAAEAVSTAAGAAIASLLLLSYSPPLLFVVNAASFAISALLIARVNRVASVRSRMTASAASHHQLIARRAFWPLQATRGVAAFVSGLDVVLLAVIASRDFHNGSSGYGWLLAAAGVGGLIAAIPARRNDGRSTAVLATGGLIVYALPLMIFATDPPVPVGIAAQVVRGIGGVLVIASVVSGLQLAVPSAVAGRIFGMTQSLVLAGTCLGAVVAPALITLVGFRATMIVGAAIPIGLQFVLAPALHRFDKGQADLIAQLEPRLAVLRSVDLLHAASRATLYEIADGIEEVDVAPDTVIIREGDQADALYILVSGTVEASALHDGRQVHLRNMHAPDYFGEIGLIHGVPRTATVTSREPAHLWRVPADFFLSAVASSGVSGALSDMVFVRLNTTPAQPSAVALTHAE